MTQPDPPPLSDPMTFLAFMSKMLKPTYVWRMASGIVPSAGAREDHPLIRSARTRMRNAERQIDDLVLQRALVIADERRCAARGTAPGALVPAIRCEYQRDHDPIYGRISLSRNSMAANDHLWDHAAPSAKLYWMETA